MKKITLLLPTCATLNTNPGETIITKLMLTTWKKNIFAQLPTYEIVATAPSLVDCATVMIASSSF
jgi:hypothetical protein